MVKENVKIRPCSEFAFRRQTQRDENVTLKVSRRTIDRIVRGNRWSFGKPATEFMRRMLEREGELSFVVLSDGERRLLCEVERVEVVPTPEKLVQEAGAALSYCFHISGWGLAE